MKESVKMGINVVINTGDGCKSIIEYLRRLKKGKLE